MALENKKEAMENLDKAVSERNQVMGEQDNATAEAKVISAQAEQVAQQEIEAKTDNEKAVEIPEVDYVNLSQEELLAHLKLLIDKYPIASIKEAVDSTRLQFNANFDKAAAESKATFIEEGGNEIDFYYTTPLKQEFNKVFFKYKDLRSQHYKNVQTNLEKNLSLRLQLIEDLKTLVDDEVTSVNKKFSKFNAIKEAWHEAGNIPKDQNNIVWKTFYHHVDRFYEIVHLDNAFRDKNYKENLEQKLLLIDRAKELVGETNINRAFRELQVLHKIWKEEIGPVAKEYKEVVWEKFSDLSKEIHAKRQAYFAAQEIKQKENLEVKKAIIAQVEEISQQEYKNSQEWQAASKKVQELHEAFKTAGKVPMEFKNSIWEAYRTAERGFNKLKNEFYKQVKGDQLENLEKKLKLVAQAEDNKDSDDFELTTPLMKKIQQEWKQIGQVPRKDSDKIWKQFRAACNYYFDRISQQREDVLKIQEEALEKKQAFLEKLKEETIDSIEVITAKIKEWKALGAVPYNKREVESQFSAVLDDLFAKLNFNKKEAELIKFDNRIAEIQAQEDTRLIADEKNNIRKKIEEIKSEILQLQNNLQFFKHADTSNPLVAEVHKKIKRHEDDLVIWNAKWNKIKNL